MNRLILLFCVLVSGLFAEGYPSLKSLIWDRNMELAQKVVGSEWEGARNVFGLDPLPRARFTLADGTVVWVRFSKHTCRDLAESIVREVRDGLLAVRPSVEDLDFFAAKVGLIVRHENEYYGLAVEKLEASNGGVCVTGRNGIVMVRKPLDPPLAIRSSFYLDDSPFRTPEGEWGERAIKLADGWLTTSGRQKSADEGFYLLINSEEGVWTKEKTPFHQHIVRVRKNFARNRRLID